jgi:hypothetical protein
MNHQHDNARIGVAEVFEKLVRRLVELEARQVDL